MGHSTELDFEWPQIKYPYLLRHYFSNPNLNAGISKNKEWIYSNLEKNSISNIAIFSYFYFFPLLH